MKYTSALLLMFCLMFVSCGHKVDVEKFKNGMANPSSLITDFSSEDYSQIMDIMEKDINEYKKKGFNLHDQNPEVQELYGEIQSLLLNMAYVSANGKLDDAQSIRFKKLSNESLDILLPSIRKLDEALKMPTHKPSLYD